MFFLFFIQLIRIDRLAVFQNNVSLFDLREMILKNFGSIVHGDRNDRASGLGCDLERAVFKRKQT